MKGKKYFNGILSAILFLSLLIFSNNSLSQTNQDGQKKYVKLQVDGLACPLCAYGLEKKLKALDGAENFNIDFKEGYATFDLPESTKITKEELKQIVSDAGFSLKSVVFSDKPFRIKNE